MSEPEETPKEETFDERKKFTIIVRDDEGKEVGKIEEVTHFVCRGLNIEKDPGVHYQMLIGEKPFVLDLLMTGVTQLQFPLFFSMWQNEIVKRQQQAVKQKRDGIAVADKRILDQMGNPAKKGKK